MSIYLKIKNVLKDKERNKQHCLMKSLLNWGYLRIPLEIVNNLNFIIADPEKGSGNSMFYPFSEGCGSGTALNSTDLTTSRFSLVYADIPHAVIYF